MSKRTQKIVLAATKVVVAILTWQILATVLIDFSGSGIFDSDIRTGEQVFWIVVAAVFTLLLFRSKSKVQSFFLLLFVSLLSFGMALLTIVGHIG